ncbi:MAG: hypothetical protein RL654_1242 [Pseudomonadota bacterium]|jgi:hypothetical protein
MNPTPDEAEAIHRERLRQQLLMTALGRREADALAGWARPLARAGVARGLGAYVVNAGAHAERALAARHPTVQALLGEAAFAQVARRHWQMSPPRCADLALWGDRLPEALADDGRLVDLPCLAEVAWLDDRVAQAERAGDAEARPDTLLRLADTEADQLVLRAAPGLAMLDARHPVVSIWRAHHDPAVRDRPDPFAEARAALSQGRGETALVWRQGWTVRVAALVPAEAAFVRCALLEARPLAEALERAGETFDFGAWLAPAVADALVLRLDLRL